VPDHLAQPGRTVEVPLRRLEQWLAGFAARHGAVQPLGPATRPDGPASWEIAAADGSGASVHAPGWLLLVAPGLLDAPLDQPALSGLCPSFGAVLIRRAGYAIGLFRGPELVERKVGSRHIHGRTAAGGWSQQRYARRRDNQADEIASAAAEAAARILSPAAGGPGTASAATAPAPVFLVTGGDRKLLAAVLAELPPSLAELPVAAHLGIGTPDAKVLAAVPERALAVRIDLREPSGRPDSSR
jgi:Actinobacteria/chloroflexi VLRF1 release factor